MSWFWTPSKELVEQEPSDAQYVEQEIEESVPFPNLEEEALDNNVSHELISNFTEAKLRYEELIFTLRHEKRDLQEELAKQAELLDIQDKQVETLQRTVNDYVWRLGEAESSLKDLMTADYSRLNTQLKESRAFIEGLEAFKSDALVELDSLQEKLHAAEMKIKQLEDNREFGSIQNEDIQKFSSEIYHLKAINDEKTNELLSLQQKYDLLNNQMIEMESTVQSLKTSLELAQSSYKELSAASVDKNAVTARLSEKDSIIESLKAELESSRVKFSQVSEEHSLPVPSAGAGATPASLDGSGTHTTASVAPTQESVLLGSSSSVYQKAREKLNARRARTELSSSTTHLPPLHPTDASNSSQLLEFQQQLSRLEKENAELKKELAMIPGQSAFAPPQAYTSSGSIAPYSSESTPREKELEAELEDLRLRLQESRMEAEREISDMRTQLANACSAADEAAQQLAALSSHVTQSVDSLESHNSEIDVRATQEYKDLVSELHSRNSEVSTLHDTINGLQSTIEALDRDLASERTQNSTSSEHLRTLQEELVSQEKALRSEIQALQSQLQAAEDNTTIAEQEAEGLYTQISSLGKQLEEKSAELASLQQQYISLQSVVDEKSVLVEKLPFVEREAEELRGKCKSLELELDTLQNSAGSEEMTQSMEAANARVQQLEQERDDLLAQVSTLYSRFQALEEEKQSLLSRLEEETSALQLRVKEQEALMNASSSYNSNLEEQVTQLREAESSLEEQNQLLSSQISELMQRLQVAQDRSNDFEEQLENSIKEVEEKRTQHVEDEIVLQELRQQLQQHTEEKTRMETEMEALKEQHLRELATFSTEMESLRVLVIELQRNVENASARYEAAEFSLSFAQSAADDDKAALNAEIEELKQKIEELKEVNADLTAPAGRSSSAPIVSFPAESDSLNHASQGVMNHYGEGISESNGWETDLIDIDAIDLDVPVAPPSNDVASVESREGEGTLETSETREQIPRGGFVTELEELTSFSVQPVNSVSSLPIREATTETPAGSPSHLLVSEDTVPMVPEDDYLRLQTELSEALDTIARLRAEADARQTIPELNSTVSAQLPERTSGEDRFTNTLEALVGNPMHSDSGIVNTESGWGPDIDIGIDSFDENTVSENTGGSSSWNMNDNNNSASVFGGNDFGVPNLPYPQSSNNSTDSTGVLPISDHFSGQHSVSNEMEYAHNIQATSARSRSTSFTVIESGTAGFFRPRTGSSVSAREDRGSTTANQENASSQNISSMGIGFGAPVSTGNLFASAGSSQSVPVSSLPPPPTSTRSSAPSVAPTSPDVETLRQLNDQIGNERKKAKDLESYVEKLTEELERVQNLLADKTVELSTLTESQEATLSALERVRNDLKAAQDALEANEKYTEQIELALSESQATRSIDALNSSYHSPNAVKQQELEKEKEQLELALEAAVAMATSTRIHLSTAAHRALQAVHAALAAAGIETPENVPISSEINSEKEVEESLHWIVTEATIAAGVVTSLRSALAIANARIAAHGDSLASIAQERAAIAAEFDEMRRSLEREREAMLQELSQPVQRAIDSIKDAHSVAFKEGQASVLPLSGSGDVAPASETSGVAAHAGTSALDRESIDAEVDRRVKERMALITSTDLSASVSSLGNSTNASNTSGVNRAQVLKLLEKAVEEAVNRTRAEALDRIKAERSKRKAEAAEHSERLQAERARAQALEQELRALQLRAALERDREAAATSARARAREECESLQRELRLANVALEAARGAADEKGAELAVALEQLRAFGVRVQGLEADLQFLKAENVRLSVSERAMQEKITRHNLSVSQSHAGSRSNSFSGDNIDIREEDDMEKARVIPTSSLFTRSGTSVETPPALENRHLNEISELVEALSIAKTRSENLELEVMDKDGEISYLRSRSHGLELDLDDLEAVLHDINSVLLEFELSHPSLALPVPENQEFGVDSADSSNSDSISRVNKRQQYTPLLQRLSALLAASGSLQHVQHSQIIDELSTAERSMLVAKVLFLTNNDVPPCTCSESAEIVTHDADVVRMLLTQTANQEAELMLLKSAVAHATSASSSHSVNHSVGHFGSVPGSRLGSPSSASSTAAGRRPYSRHQSPQGKPHADIDEYKHRSDQDSDFDSRLMGALSAASGRRSRSGSSSSLQSHPLPTVHRYSEPSGQSLPRRDSRSGSLSGSVSGLKDGELDLHQPSTRQLLFGSDTSGETFSSRSRRGSFSHEAPTLAPPNITTSASLVKHGIASKSGATSLGLTMRREGKIASEIRESAAAIQSQDHLDAVPPLPSASSGHDLVTSDNKHEVPVEWSHRTGQSQSTGMFEVETSRTIGISTSIMEETNASANGISIHTDQNNSSSFISQYDSAPAASAHHQPSSSGDIGELKSLRAEREENAIKAVRTRRASSPGIYARGGARSEMYVPDVGFVALNEEPEVESSGWDDLQINLCGLENVPVSETSVPAVSTALEQPPSGWDDDTGLDNPDLGAFYNQVEPSLSNNEIMEISYSAELAPSEVPTSNTALVDSEMQAALQMALPPPTDTTFSEDTTGGPSTPSDFAASLEVSAPNAVSASVDQNMDETFVLDSIDFGSINEQPVVEVAAAPAMATGDVDVRPENWFLDFQTYPVTTNAELEERVGLINGYIGQWSAFNESEYHRMMAEDPSKATEILAYYQNETDRCSAYYNDLLSAIEISRAAIEHAVISAAAQDKMVNPPTLSVESTRGRSNSSTSRNTRGRARSDSIDSSHSVRSTSSNKSIGIGPNVHPHSGGPLSTRSRSGSLRPSRSGSLTNRSAIDEVESGAKLDQGIENAVDGIMFTHRSSISDPLLSTMETSLQQSSSKSGVSGDSSSSSTLLSTNESHPSEFPSSSDSLVTEVSPSHVNQELTPSNVGSNEGDDTIDFMSGIPLNAANSVSADVSSGGDIFSGYGETTVYDGPILGEAEATVDENTQVESTTDNQVNPEPTTSSSINTSETQSSFSVFSGSAVNAFPTEGTSTSEFSPFTPFVGFQSRGPSSVGSSTPGTPLGSGGALSGGVVGTPTLSSSSVSKKPTYLRSRYADTTAAAEDSKRIISDIASQKQAEIDKKAGIFAKMGFGKKEKVSVDPSTVAAEILAGITKPPDALDASKPPPIIPVATPSPSSSTPSSLTYPNSDSHSSLSRQGSRSNLFNPAAVDSLLPKRSDSASSRKSNSSSAPPTSLFNPSNYSSTNSAAPTITSYDPSRPPLHSHTTGSQNINNASASVNTPRSSTPTNSGSSSSFYGGVGFATPQPKDSSIRQPTAGVNPSNSYAFQTPVGSILTADDLIEGDGYDDEEDEVVEEIVEAADGVPVITEAGWESLGPEIQQQFIAQLSSSFSNF